MSSSRHSRPPAVMRTAPRSRRPSTIGRERGPATREEGGPRAAGPCVRADPSAPSRRGSDSVAPARRLSWCSRRVSRRALTRGDTPDQKEFPPVSGVAAREAAHDARRWHERGLPRPYHRTRLSSRSPGTRARNASRRLGRRQRDARCGRTPGAPSGSTYWLSCLCTTFGTSSRTARLVFVQTRRATGSEPGARIVYLSGSDGLPIRGLEDPPAGRPSSSLLLLVRPKAIVRATCRSAASCGGSAGGTWGRLAVAGASYAVIFWRSAEEDVSCSRYQRTVCSTASVSGVARRPSSVSAREASTMNGSSNS